MNKNDKIYIAGHSGMVGSAIMRNLEAKGYSNIITRSSADLDLTRQAETEDFIGREKPDYVFLAAAKVGGIYANSTYPADFAYINLAIECNVIKASYDNKVKKLLFLGSSCIYPRLAPQPIEEKALLTSELEKTNEAYALAKISGLKMCEYFNIQYGTDYISVMPTNLYGINDGYHEENSHVIPALIQRFHEAKINNEKQVTIWGTGNALREFLFVDDVADACIFLMNNYSGNETVNVGTGKDLSIRELAETMKRVIGFEGDLIFDKTKPDGTPRKLLDVSKINKLGWTYKTAFEDGLKIAYEDFLKRYRNKQADMLKDKKW